MEVRHENGAPAPRARRPGGSLALVVEQQVDDHTGGDRHQQEVAVVAAYPAVAARRLAQMVGAPVVYHVAGAAVFHRQVAAAPVPALVLTAVMPVPVVAVGVAAIVVVVVVAVVVAMTMVVVAAAAITIVLVLTIMPPVVPVVVVLRQRSAAGQHQHHATHDRQTLQLLHGDLHSMDHGTRPHRTGGRPAPPCDPAQNSSPAPQPGMNRPSPAGFAFSLQQPPPLG